MAAQLDRSLLQTGLQRYSRREADRCVKRVIHRLARDGSRLTLDGEADGEPSPCWITPAQLVRAMKRFLVYN